MSAPSGNYSAPTRYKSNDIRNPHPSYGGTAASKSNRTDSKNIMHDRRVIRGSTYSLRRSIENRLKDITQQSKSSSNASKRSTAKRRVKSRKADSYQYNNKTATPRAVTGRLHAEIQTDPYLEEITVTKPEKEFGTQTDPLLDRPSIPLFIPKPSGASIATQIEDGDLFDFDHEIEPILEVLIGKTIEMSLMEVLEEEELKSFQKYKAEFEQKRNVELAKCQQLEEEERRREQEKENRIKQAQIQKEKELQIKKRIEAQRIATELLENIENAVLDELDKNGYFYDPVIKEIETEFMPNLLKDVAIKVSDAQICNWIMNDIIQCFVQNMMNDAVRVIQDRDETQKEDEKQAIFQRQLNEAFVEKRRIFTQSIKSQRNDFDFKPQIVEFLNIPISAPSAKESVENDDDDKKDEDVENKPDENVENESDEDPQEIAPEIQQNIEYINTLMEQFENSEEALWKQIKSMLNKIEGDLSYKIERMDLYLEKFSIKSCKKELLATFEIYKNEDQLKKTVMDCLEIDTFDDEIHGKLMELLKNEEQEQQMKAIEELIRDKEDIKQFVSNFIKVKAEEREVEKANEAEENPENEDENE